LPRDIATVAKCSVEQNKQFRFTGLACHSRKVLEAVKEAYKALTGTELPESVSLVASTDGESCLAGYFVEEGGEYQLGNSMADRLQQRYSIFVGNSSETLGAAASVMNGLGFVGGVCYVVNGGSQLFEACEPLGAANLEALRALGVPVELGIPQFDFPKDAVLDDRVVAELRDFRAEAKRVVTTSGELAVLPDDIHAEFSVKQTGASDVSGVKYAAVHLALYLEHEDWFEGDDAFPVPHGELRGLQEWQAEEFDDGGLYWGLSAGWSCPLWKGHGVREIQELIVEKRRLLSALLCAEAPA
jgi:hypothetical protein